MGAGWVRRRAGGSQTSLLRMSPKASNSSQMTRKSKRKTCVPADVRLHCWRAVASLRKIIWVLFPSWALSVTCGFVFEPFYDLTTELWRVQSKSHPITCQLILLIKRWEVLLEDTKSKDQEEAASTSCKQWQLVRFCIAAVLLDLDSIKGFYFFFWWTKCFYFTPDWLWKEFSQPWVCKTVSYSAATCG